MERIGIEDARKNMADIIKRVEAGEEIILTRYGRDIAHITMPEIEQTRKVQAFFSLLKSLKLQSPTRATSNEIEQWVREGRA